MTSRASAGCSSAAGTLDGRRYLKEPPSAPMFAPPRIGETTRGLGWDMSSAYSRALGSFFPTGSVGHTGFTGTSIWIDPASRRLRDRPDQPRPSERQGQRGGPAPPGERGRWAPRFFGVGEAPAGRRVAAADAASAVHGARSADPRRPRAARRATRTGLDQLVAQDFAPLAGRSVGLVTNQTGVDAQGRRDIDLLATAPGVRLRAIFSPEHGLDRPARRQCAARPRRRHRAARLEPLRRRAAAVAGACWRGIDTLVFDVQDVGVALLHLSRPRSSTCWRRRARRGIAGGRARPAQPHHRARTSRGPLMDADLALVHRAAHRSRCAPA